MNEIQLTGNISELAYNSIYPYRASVTFDITDFDKDKINSLAALFRENDIEISIKNDTCPQSGEFNGQRIIIKQINNKTA